MFLSQTRPLEALKRWFKSRLSDMGTSIGLLKDAKAAVDGNAAVSEVIEVVDVRGQGPDWILRDFDPVAPPLADAVGSDTAAQAAQARALRALEGATNPELMSIRAKILDGSENLRWSTGRQKILVIDMQ